jgi:enoyl-CoA hydratase/carnithine racemase/AcrR family transcriptional regulator
VSTVAGGGRPGPAARTPPRARHRGALRPRPRRDKLLAAAAALFAERGYGAVTLGDIGGAVGISGPGVYRHFKSKESLLGELLVDVSERLLSSARERVAATTSPAEALVALVDFHAGFAVDNPSLIVVQARELSSLALEDQHRVRRLQHSYVELWADTIVQLGSVENHEEALVAAHATFGLLNSTPFSNRLDTNQMRARLHSMALAAVTAGAAGDGGPGREDNHKEGAMTDQSGGPGQQGAGRRAGGGPGAAPTPLVRTVQDGAVTELVLDRPEAMNAISTTMARELAAACAELGRRPSVQVIVVSSTSERAFCVGADLKERARFSNAELEAQRPVLRAAFQAVRALEVPVIAAINGYALGGGFEIALSCDLIVADETAEVALPETAIGLVPGGGGTQLLLRRAGPAAAADLIFTARRVAAPEALRLGLVDRVVPRGTARAVALELAGQMAANSPVAVAAAKRAMRLGAGVDLPAGLEVEEAAWRVAETSPDRSEGIAAFVQKRAPDWPSRASL